MSDKIKIALICTNYQRTLINTIELQEKIEFIKIHPQENKFNFEHNEVEIATPLKKNPLLARSLIKEVKTTIEKLCNGKEMEVWLANCESPVGQILINHTKCKKVVLFEDGIGSYIKHSPLQISEGLTKFIKKLYYIISLFPHYRSFSGIGSHEADDYWAIHKNAFPKTSKTIKIIKTELLKEKIKLQVKNYSPPNNTEMIFIDQPLVRNKIIKKEEFEKILKLLANKVQRKNPCGTILIKPHPSCLPIEIEKTLGIFKKNTTTRIEIIPQHIPIESIALSSPTSIEHASILSTALYTIKSISPECNTNSYITQKALKKNKNIAKYIEALKSTGVNIIKIE